MADLDKLRMRLAAALVVGLMGCGDEKKDDGISVDLGKISGGKSSKREKPDDDGGAAESSGTASAGATTLDEAKPPIDPVEFCRTLEMTMNKEDADRRRSPGTAEDNGCPNTIDDGTGYGRLMLRTAATQLLRDAGDDVHCCYEEMVMPKTGRPFVTEAGQWLPAFSIGVRRHAPIARAAAMAWLRDARMEHASVTSFLRAALELRGVGAPATLVDACVRASADERRHAAMCLDLAQRLSGRALQLGPLPEPVARPGGLAAVLCRTFTEGCVAETIAAHLAACAAARTDDPRIRSVLTQIADDEADHAALAWTTLGWGLPRLPAAAREAFFAWARARTPRGESAGRPITSVGHGRLTPASTRAIAARVGADLVMDLLRSGAREVDVVRVRRRAGARVGRHVEV